MKTKEKLFCANYCRCRSARLAAAQAGYGIFAKKTAARLMGRTDIQSEIERIDSAAAVSEGEIINGWRKMAFGSAADAFRLVLSDEPVSEQEIYNLDLTNVSEIKRPKGGGLEIKFFDRLKAIEKLAEISAGSGDENELVPFYTAIERSAAASDDADA